jgi:hypothetical protein
LIFDLGGTLWYWPNRDPARQGAWFWGLCHDHLRRQALAEKSAEPLLATRREAFAEAMVASEEEYRRSAREQTYSADPLGIVAVGFARLGFSLGEQELLAVQNMASPPLQCLLASGALSVQTNRCFYHSIEPVGALRPVK